MRTSPWPWLSPAAATLAIFALGAVLFLRAPGDGLARLSYDLPFLVRAGVGVPPTEVVLVYLDEASAAELHQSPDAAWDRSIHARFLDRMTEGGARAVLFDIIFAADSPADEEFAAAIRRNGHVVLSASMEISQELGVVEHTLIAPNPTLREAAAAWGLANFEPEEDHAVRKLFANLDDFPSAPCALMEHLGEHLRLPSLAWLSYYGPPDTIRNVSFAQALHGDGVPPDYFRHKIVVVGGRPTISQIRLQKDEFAGPWSRWVSRFHPGTETHATAVLNLLRHEWLIRIAPAKEWMILALTSLFCGVLLTRLRPRAAFGAALLAVLTIAALTVIAFRMNHLWLAWLIPAGVQVPVGFVWSVSARYLFEARRRAALRRAFSLYLSPHMAERIDAAKFDPAPGGQLVEATVMFTDLEGFTTLSEELNDPAELSAILIRYYNKTTACILENDGTIIKYMGDAVEAVWNAPVEDPEHAFRAVTAACRLREVARFTAHGREIRTRVGIHTGPAFAGNLGSEFRFDYAVIGDTTNLAARLESLNKRFGTDVLLSSETVERLGGRFITRPLGRFRVAGKKVAVAIHELVATAEDAQDRPWLASFSEALPAFAAGDFASARQRLLLTRELHGGHDGPAEFYLALIDELEPAGHAPGWDGVIEFAGK